MAVMCLRIMGLKSEGGMRHHLEEVNWSTVLVQDDIDATWSNFIDIVRATEDMFIPIKTLKIGGGKKKFFPLDKDVVALIKTKGRLSRKLSRNPSADLWTEYNRVRNKVKKLCNRAKKKYEEDLSAI